MAIVCLLWVKWLLCVCVLKSVPWNFLLVIFSPYSVFPLLPLSPLLLLPLLPFPLSPPSSFLPLLPLPSFTSLYPREWKGQWHSSIFWPGQIMVCQTVALLSSLCCRMCRKSRATPRDTPRTCPRSPHTDHLLWSTAVLAWEGVGHFAPWTTVSMNLKIRDEWTYRVPWDDYVIREHMQYRQTNSTNSAIEQ